LGGVLIVAGLSIAVWISRPYITFLFATSKIETLQKKAELLGHTQGDMVKKSDESDKKTEVPIQIRSDETKKSESLERSASLFESVRRDAIKSTIEN